MKHSYHLIHPEKKTSSIRVVVSHNGKKYARATGLSIPTSLWNAKAKSLQAKCKQVEVRDRLLEIDLRLSEREMLARSERDVLSAIDYALGDTPSPSFSFSMWNYFREWSERNTPSKRYRQLAYKRISEMMGERTDWGDVDGDFVFRLTRECDARGYSYNYKSTLVSKFKTMMKEAYDRGIHTNDAWKLFKTGYKTADTIALSEAEVDALWDAPLSGRDALVRDVFIVGVYCAGRFQDYSKLSVENIVDGRLRYVQRKTGQTVIIPLSPRISEVFSRHGGSLPSITEQEVGRRIKCICRGIGGSFNEIVEVRKIRGGVSGVERHPRWEMVSTHTARRSGASILYKSGVPIRVCRFLTGHSTDSMFLAYIKCTKEEGADILAQSEFFKKY